jgi:zinc/manganese transport system substrate-binding protein
MTQFTQAVAGERAEVVQLIPSNVGIHDFQAKPRDVETIARADVLVQNGVGLETFLTDLIRNAANPDLTIVEASEGIPTVSSPDPGEESHTEDDQGHHHSHGGVNPHLWLDPVRAITQVENIRQGLVAADPQGQEIYEANAATYIQALKDLNQELGALLSPYAGQTFITFHDFAVYFAQRYGLRVEFLVEVPELSPSPQDLDRIISLIKAENIRALLTEPSAGKESLSALAQDLQLEISVFDPLENGDPAPETYFQIMRQNAENIANALSSN